MLDTGTTIYPCVVILTFLSVLTDGFDVIIKYSPDKLPLKPLPVEVTMTCEFQLLKSAFFTLTWNQGTEVLYTRTNQSGIPGTPFVDRIQEQEFFLSTDSSVYSRHVMKFNVTLCDGKETSYRCKVRQSGDTPSTQLKSMIFNDPEINLVNITAGSSSIGSMMPGVTSDDLGVQYDGFTDKVAYVNITSTCDATLDFTNAQHSLKYNSKTCVNSGTYTAFSVTFNKDGKCPVNVTVTTDSGTSISVIKDIEVNSAETTTVEMSTAQVLTSTVEKTTTTSVTTTSTKLTPSTAVPSTAVPSTAVPSTAAPTTTAKTSWWIWLVIGLVCALGAALGYSLLRLCILVMEVRLLHRSWVYVRNKRTARFTLYEVVPKKDLSENNHYENCDSQDLVKLPYLSWKKRFQDVKKVETFKVFVRTDVGVDEYENTWYGIREDGSIVYYGYDGRKSGRTLMQVPSDDINKFKFDKIKDNIMKAKFKVFNHQTETMANLFRELNLSKRKQDGAIDNLAYTELDNRT